MELRLPRVLAAIELALTVVVHVRVLDARSRRDGIAHSRGVAGPAIEVRAEGLRSIAPLILEERVKRRERWERQRFAVGRKPAADRPAAPAEEGAHRVVAAERGRSGCDRVAATGDVPPLEVHSD